MLSTRNQLGARDALQATVHSLCNNQGEGEPTDALALLTSSKLH
jgi:hypothetical protein